MPSLVLFLFSVVSCVGAWNWHLTNPRTINPLLRESAVDKWESSTSRRSPAPVLPQADLLGMINFCLQSTDRALSGPSRSKVLNELTNDVFKAVMIGYDPWTNEVLSRFPQPQQAAIGTGSDDVDVTYALHYVRCLEELARNGITQADILSGPYDTGYRRLLTFLRDSGCLHLIHSADAAVVPTRRPRPADKNICLSLMDRARSSVEGYASRTMELNHLANVASRTMLYGGHNERSAIGAHLQKRAERFRADWNIPEGDVNGEQEVNFIQVLALLLTENLAAAVAASNVGPSFTVDARTGKICPPSGEQLGKNALVSSFRLHDAYQNAFQRVVEMCILEGRGEYATQQNDELWQNFLSWEQGIRSNLTSEMWENRPQELVGAWELMEVSGAGSLQAIMTAPTEELFAEPMGAGSIIEFAKDGKVHVKHSTCEGISWSFKPGPAHLDTCEFTIRSASTSESAVLLQYVGFIDRGQRVESRFSKLPIRMTGRVLSCQSPDNAPCCESSAAITAGSVSSSNGNSGRFVMKLQRR